MWSSCATGAGTSWPTTLLPVAESGTTSCHPDAPIGTLSLGGDGARTSLLCGAYHLDQGRPHPLLGQLPALIHLPPGRAPTPN